MGAGRRKVKVSGTGMPKATAEKILDSVPELEYWRDLIVADVQAVVGKGENKRLETFTDKRLRLEVLKYLTDKRDGKAPLAIQHTGPDGGEPTVRVVIEHIGSKDSATA